MHDDRFQLASGGIARVYGGTVEFVAPTGEIQASFDAGDFVAVLRNGQTVTLRHRQRGDLAIAAANSDEAMRLEAAVSSARSVIDVPPAAGVVTTPGAPQRQPVHLDDQLRDQVREILMPNEDIVFIAHQDQRAPTVKKAAAIATDHRLILYRPSLMGSFNFWDKRWHDIQDVHLKQGMLFSDLVIRTVAGEVISLDKMNKDEARRIYSIAQQQEAQWKEIRRQRQMEEDRARAGGVTVTNTLTPTAPGDMQPAPQAASPAVEDPMAKLQRAKQMLDNGLITQAEYDEVKHRILSQM